ncbi:MAG: uroporphyrinogen decarboxylase family protein [Phycisphaerae bacterium]
MTGKERAIKALNFEAVDRVPIWGGWITSADFLNYISGKSYWDDPWGTIVAAHRKLGVDLFPGEVYGPHSREEFRSMDFVTTMKESHEKFKEPEDVLDFIKALPKPESLEKDFDFGGRYKELLSDLIRHQDDCGDDILWLPVFRTCYFNWHVEFGNELFFLALGLYPEAMKNLFEFAGERARLDNLVRLELFRKQGLPLAMFNGVDLCDNRGPMVSPELLRKIYFPSLKHSLQPLVNAGVTVIWHSDGYIVPLFEDLIDCGVRGFQGFQVETGVQLECLPKLKLPGGKKPALWGSISVTRTLPFGTVEDVKREVERCIDTLAPGGGYFLGTANTVGPEVPFENLIALYEHTQEYGKGKG